MMFVQMLVTEKAEEDNSDTDADDDNNDHGIDDSAVNVDDEDNAGNDADNGTIERMIIAIMVALVLM